MKAFFKLRFIKGLREDAVEASGPTVDTNIHVQPSQHARAKHTLSKRTYLRFSTATLSTPAVIAMHTQRGFTGRAVNTSTEVRPGNITSNKAMSNSALPLGSDSASHNESPVKKRCSLG
jgi:hypothetical protein